MINDGIFSFSLSTEKNNNIMGKTKELFAVRPRITERILATKHSDKAVLCFFIVLAWVKKSPSVSLAVSTKKTDPRKPGPVVLLSSSDHLYYQWHTNKDQSRAYQDARIVLEERTHVLFALFFFRFNCVHLQDETVVLLDNQHTVVREFSSSSQIEDFLGC